MMTNVPAAPTYRSNTQSVAPADAAPDEARGAAVQFLGQLAAEVSSGTVNLPCFPDIVIRVRNALADPSTTPEQTVTIVGAEPRLAGRLLQTANSAAFNQTGKPVTDLRTAITRLGHQFVQSAAMAFAVQQMKDEKSLCSIAKLLNELWLESIAAASICRDVARRTKVDPEEAFLTGLLHGIGRLYIMVRAVGKLGALRNPRSFLELVSEWHASIGQAVLANWGFAEEMSAAVGDQKERERKHKGDADLSDILIAGVALGKALKKPSPRVVEVDGIDAFSILGLSAKDCISILTYADREIQSLQDALGCKPAALPGTRPGA
jgi:HD-like signal output (HDOD) protein